MKSMIGYKKYLTIISDMVSGAVLFIGDEKGSDAPAGIEGSKNKIGWLPLTHYYFLFHLLFVISII